MSRIFWIAPVFPLVAWLVAGALGRARSRLVANIAVGALVLSTIVAVALLVDVARGAQSAVSVSWLTTAGREFSFALRLDALSAILLALIAIVALLVTTYATTYMSGDPRYTRFFSLLSLFVGAMMVLVIADDVLVFFVAWELVGLCSYLLIGFWYEKPEAARAATQAFLVTRIGDLALLAGLLMLAAVVGSGSISSIVAAADASAFSPALAVAAAWLLLAGAAGKSAQLPLQAWLPDAMAGPTPVSALIHSATMVAAGVYLVARFLPLFEASGIVPAVAWLGAATSLSGAASALAQTDLKRLLAYSTMSQLGLMFVALGSGSLVAGIVLLIGQGLFKSLLFLGAGSVDHAAGTTDLRALGGLRRRMPATFALFALGAAALAGLPITLAWPVKDAALGAAWERSLGLFAIALAASLLTALYAARATTLAFLGAPRSEMAARARESDRGLVWPMAALAALLVAGGTAGSPLVGEPLAAILGAPLPEVPVATLIAVAVALIGVAVGVAAYGRSRASIVSGWRHRVADASRAGFGSAAVYRATARGAVLTSRALLGVDRRVFDPVAGGAAALIRRLTARARGVDQAVFDRRAPALAGLVRRGVTHARAMDLWVFDATADRLARAMLSLVRASRHVDLARVDAAFDAAGNALLRAGQRLRAIQTGRVYNYFVPVFAWSIGALVVTAVVIAFRSTR